MCVSTIIVSMNCVFMHVPMHINAVHCYVIYEHAYQQANDMMGCIMYLQYSLQEKFMSL